MKITDDTVIIRKASLRPADMNGQLAMLNEETGKYIILNQVGTFIWNMVAQPVPVSDIVARLTEEFDVTRDECFIQVKSYLENLKKERLLDIIKP